MNNISKQTNILELYYSFQENFFPLIDNNIGAWEEADLIKQYYNDYEFNKIRIIVDHKVSIWQKAVLEAILKGRKGSIIYNEAYMAWKLIDNTFSEFNEKYEELFELNII